VIRSYPKGEKIQMETIIGIVVIVVGLICWIGQSLSFLAPHIAIRIGLCEPENEMDQTLYIIETKAHGLNDMILTWTAAARIVAYAVGTSLFIGEGGVVTKSISYYFTIFSK
jgi:hypothetical protein